ncbi:uncharacterized protein EV422DRAFT_502668 [Fimicolochytrium jonesii]|uniref:uncharacterized protein n=1 Tax=Fimicolochytrium jonesii TaxID=1396493 RepID=UPI0022FDDEBD|nr:uncharacterized protein EV422DRAFT_502668 [Fimicolochytrium jonesii]KAI8826948.1 hypothetical protein EV422DRAFT_502668 [Fimicolochytrium jonesii]
MCAGLEIILWDILVLIAIVLIVIWILGFFHVVTIASAPLIHVFIIVGVLFLITWVFPSASSLATIIPVVRAHRKNIRDSSIVLSKPWPLDAIYLILPRPSPFIWMPYFCFGVASRKESKAAIRKT